MIVLLEIKRQANRLSRVFKLVDVYTYSKFLVDSRADKGQAVEARTAICNVLVVLSLLAKKYNAHLHSGEVAFLKPLIDVLFD